MLIEGLDLCCVRGRKEVFSGVHFSLDSGQVLRVTGPNGAGKSSLLRMIAGLLQPTDGNLRWDGVNDFDASTRLLYIGHSNALKDDLSAVENLASLCQFSGISATENEIRSNLKKSGLHAIADVPAGELSQGQKRRVTLARLDHAFAKQLWILDEPFSALDERSLQFFKHQLVSYVAGGGQLIYTTHQEIDAFHHQHQTLDLKRFAPC